MKYISQKCIQWGTFFGTLFSSSESDKELDEYIYKTQMEKILKKYIFGIKMMIIWLNILSIFLMSVYIIFGLHKTVEGREFVSQVLQFWVYTIGCYIVVRYYTQSILYLIPVTIFMIWYIVANIWVGSPEYFISEYLLCVSFLTLVIIILTPSQLVGNWIAFYTAMIYFMYQIYSSYNSIPIPLILSVLLSVGYYTFGSWLLYSEFRNLYRILFKYKKLISEMKRFIEIFPESVIIKTKDPLSNGRSYYSNNEFNHEIADIREHIRKLKDIKVSFTKDIHSEENPNYSEQQEIQTSLDEFMKYRERQLQGPGVIENTVKIEFMKVDDTEEDNSEHPQSVQRIYTVKTLKVIWDGASDSYMHVFIDLTDMFKLEKANNNIRCQKIMFASASHEFRTPLNAILNSFKLISMTLNDEGSIKNKLSWDEKNTSIQKYLKMGSSSGVLLLSLVEDVLNMSKIEAGTFKVNYGWFSVKELFDEVFELFCFQCKQKGISLHWDLDQPLAERHVYTDKGRIKQVLLNLVSNSLKFTFHGKIWIKANLLSENDPGDYLEFTVKDTGIGIKSQDQKKLFQLFGMVRSTEIINPNGSGIGLTISKKYVELLEGNINLQSTPNVGTNVSFTIKNHDQEERLADGLELSSDGEVLQLFPEYEENSAEKNLSLCWSGVRITASKNLKNFDAITGTNDMLMKKMSEQTTRHPKKL